MVQSMFVAAGPSLIARFRPDLLENFTDYCDYQTVADYIYHCNAQKPRYAISDVFYCIYILSYISLYLGSMLSN